MTATITKRCKARTTKGEPCQLPPITGADVCRSHGGAIGKVKRQAAVRAEVSRWQTTDELVDPGVQLLRLVAQSSRRAQLYAELMEQQYARAQAEHDGQEDDGLPEIPSGVAALIGYKWGANSKDGTLYRTEEAIRGLVALESDERDRCARFAKLAVDAGIAERQVRLAEDMGSIVVQAIKAVVTAALANGVPEQFADVFLQVAPDALRELEA